MIEEDTRKNLLAETEVFRSAVKTAAGGGSEKALLGLAYYVKSHDGDYWSLRPRWRILAPVLVVLILVGYVLIASCKFWIDRYFYGCKETPYWEMYIYVIPNRIPFTRFVFLPDFLNQIVMDVRLRQQRRIVRMATKDPENIHELFYVAMVDSANVDLQFEAAYFLAAPEWQNRIDDAFDLLDHTLPVILDKKERCGEYLERYVKFCSIYEQDNRVIRAGEKYLDDPRIPPEVRPSFALACAEAHYLKGNYAHAIELVNQYKLRELSQGFLLTMRILWETGKQGEAYTQLKARVEATGEGREQLLYELAKFEFEQEKYAEASAILKEVSDLNPNDYKSRVRSLSMQVKAGDKVGFAVGLNAFFSHFSSNSAAMLALGGYAAEQGDVSLQKRIEALALENRFSELSNFRLLIIETLVTAGRHTEALEQIGDLFMRKPIWLQKNKNVQLQFESLRMVAYFASKQTDLGTIALGRLLNEDLSLPMTVATARRLLALNCAAEAKRLLLRAYAHNHHSQNVLLELVRTDLKSESTDSLGEHLVFLLEGRRPPRRILRQAFETFGSDRFLFSPGRDALLEKMDTLLSVETP